MKTTLEFEGKCQDCGKGYICFPAIPICRDCGGNVIASLAWLAEEEEDQ